MVFNFLRYVTSQVFGFYQAGKLHLKLWLGCTFFSLGHSTKTCSRMFWPIDFEMLPIRLDFITIKNQVFFFKSKHPGENDIYISYHRDATVQYLPQLCIHICTQAVLHVIMLKGYLYLTFPLECKLKFWALKVRKIRKSVRDPLIARFMQVFMSLIHITGNLWKCLFRIFCLLYWL